MTGGYRGLLTQPRGAHTSSGRRTRHGENDDFGLGELGEAHSWRSWRGAADSQPQARGDAESEGGWGAGVVAQDGRRSLSYAGNPADRAHPRVLARALQRAQGRDGGRRICRVVRRTAPAAADIA